MEGNQSRTGETEQHLIIVEIVLSTRSFCYILPWVNSVASKRQGPRGRRPVKTQCSWSHHTAGLAPLFDIFLGRLSESSPLTQGSSLPSRGLSQNLQFLQTLLCGALSWFPPGKLAYLGNTKAFDENRFSDAPGPFYLHPSPLDRHKSSVALSIVGGIFSLWVLAALTIPSVCLLVSSFRLTTASKMQSELKEIQRISGLESQTRGRKKSLRQSLSKKGTKYQRIL